MTLEDSVHAFRLRLMARAQALRNVSKACREVGVSRTLFYRWRKRYLAYGPDGLHPRHQGPRRGRPPGLSQQEERAILALALALADSGSSSGFQPGAPTETGQPALPGQPS